MFALAMIAFWPLGGNTITRADMEKTGKIWPLSVEQVRYSCTRARGTKVAVFEFPSPVEGNKYFRLIGTPTDIRSVQLAPSMTIWRRNQSIPGAMVSVADLQQDGLKRCG